MHGLLRVFRAHPCALRGRQCHWRSPARRAVGAGANVPEVRLAAVVLALTSSSNCRRDPLKIRLCVALLVSANLVYSSALFADLLLQLDGPTPLLWRAPTVASVVTTFVQPFAILPAHLFYVDRLHALAFSRVLTVMATVLAFLVFASLTACGVIMGARAGQHGATWLIVAATAHGIELNNTYVELRQVWIVYLVSTAAFDVLIATTLSIAFVRVRSCFKACVKLSVSPLIHLARLVHYITLRDWRSLAWCRQRQWPCTAWSARSFGRATAPLLGRRQC